MKKVLVIAFVLSVLEGAVLFALPYPNPCDACGNSRVCRILAGCWSREGSRT
jgi:hypothetical protein